jgi:hypothetical protein
VEKEYTRKWGPAQVDPPLLLFVKVDDLAEANGASVLVSARRGLPLCRLPRPQRSVLVHFVDLFQTQSLELWHNQEDKEAGKDHDGAKDEHDERVVLVRNLVTEEGEEEVPDPVGRSAKTDALCSQVLWEVLTA